MTRACPAARPVAPWRAALKIRGRGVLGGVVVAVGLWSGPALAQDPPAAPDPNAAPAEPPPTLAEALAFVNEALAAHPSPWRPCRSAPALELAEDGSLTLTITRGSYCEDSQVLANVHDLDPRAVSFEIAEEAIVRLPCSDDAACSRLWQRRKRHDTEAWQHRDEDWIPGGPLGQEHLSAALELRMSSRPHVAAQVAAAMGYIVRAATADPAYAKPSPARFEQEVAQAEPAPAN